MLLRLLEAKSARVKQFNPSRLRTGIAAVTVVALAVGGLMVPRVSAGAEAGEADRVQGMAEMHNRMVTETPGMSRMHDRMVREHPAMARVHERMIVENDADRPMMPSVER